MSQASSFSPAVQEHLVLRDVRLYIVTAIMVLGNVALPYAFHHIPNGGRIFLPIFFFTLIAGWRFGLSAALFTAILSPLANHLLTGMPTAAVLPSLILQSALLGIFAAAAAGWGRRTTLLFLTTVVLLHQAVILSPVLLASGQQACFSAFRVRLPGLYLQIFGGFLLLQALARFLPFDTSRRR